MAGPGNQHCVNCIGTLSFAIVAIAWQRCGSEVSVVPTLPTSSALTDIRTTLETSISFPMRCWSSRMTSVAETHTLKTASQRFGNTKCMRLALLDQCSTVASSSPSSSSPGLTPRIPQTVYRYFWAYPYFTFQFLCLPLISFSFRAID